MKHSKIWVICGGISEERDVSLRSGKNVYEAILRLGYKEVKLFDWNSDNSLKEIIESKNKIDKAILMTHGNYGEDGRIQGLLDILGIPYNGPDHLVSAICMNKTRTKEILAYNGLKVLPSYLAREILLEDKIQGEFIFKPRSGGSSVGITKFNNWQEYKDFCESNKDLNLDNYFIEPFIKGTEITTSVLDRESKLVSLPLLELRPKNAFYDYEAKYTEGMTEFIIPAEVSEELTESIHRTALQVFQIMNCKTCARVDFIIDSKTKTPYILEVNTLPGMTNTSDMPAQAKAAGISYDELVQAIIDSIVISSETRNPMHNH